MAVNELDARTRAVENMRTDPGKEMSVYQAAENQLLAIRAEQKQNLALARQQNMAALQNNAMISQASQLVSGSGNEGPVAQQVPVNAATGKVLGKYGVGPTITKQTQKSTQHITKQNITVNNYNNTTNSTTIAPPNIGGPVQGRPLVINKNPQDDTGRFKVWVNNVISRQNEQAAIRDREYQKREAALTRSANKMTRKLEAISLSISKHLDPRRQAVTFEDQMKRLFKLIGLGVIAANWPKVMDILGNIESKVRSFLDYVGITGSEEREANGENSGLVKDIRYLLLGDRAKEVKGGLVDALKEAFTGEGGLVDVMKKVFSEWMEARSEAIKAVKLPDLSLRNDGIDGSLRKIAGYVGDILSALAKGPGATAQQVTRDARRAAAEESESEPLDKRANRRQGKYVSDDGDTHSTSVGDYIIHGYNGANNLLKTDVRNGELTSNIGASIRQSGYITSSLAGENGKVNPLAIIEGLSRLEKSAEEHEYTIIEPRLFGILQNKLGIYTQDLGRNKKKFKYISVPKTEYEKEHEEDLTPGPLKTAAGLYAAATTIQNPPSLKGPIISAAANAKKGVNFVNRLFSEENTLKLVEEDDPTYSKFKSLNKELTGNDEIEYYLATKEDISKLKSRLAERLGKEKFTFDAKDYESTRLLSDLISKQFTEGNISESAAEAIRQIQDAQGKVEESKARVNAVLEESLANGLKSRASDLLHRAKDAATTGYTDPLEGNESEATDEQSEPVVFRSARLEDIKKKTGWDVDKAIETIKRNAHQKSKGLCLRYTGNAISAGFGNNTPIERYHASTDPNFGGISSAKNSGFALEKLGFSRISNKEPLKKGDIRVYQPYISWTGKVSHPHGHIEMYDGNNWFSDFRQHRSGMEWNYYGSTATYRWEGAGKDAVNPIVADPNEPLLAEADIKMDGDIINEEKNTSNILPDVTVTPTNSTIMNTGLLANNSYSTSDFASSTAESGNSSDDTKVISEKLDIIGSNTRSSTDILALVAESVAQNVDATSSVVQAIAATAKPDVPHKSQSVPYSPSFLPSNDSNLA